MSNFDIRSITHSNTKVQHAEQHFAPESPLQINIVTSSPLFQVYSHISANMAPYNSPYNYSFANTTLFTIHVNWGFDEAVFHIHSDILCKHSSFFRTAFTSGFSETIS